MRFVVIELTIWAAGNFLAWKIGKLIYLRRLKRPAPSLRDQIAKTAPWDAL